MNHVQEAFSRTAWVVAGFALAYAPLARELPVWTTILALGVASWRLLGSYYRIGPAYRTVRIGLALLAFAAVLITFRTINGLDAGTTLLAVMGSLKLLESHDRRGQVVMLLVSYFLVIANFLFSQSIGALLWMLPSILVITTALLQTTKQNEPLPNMRALRTAGTLLLQATPLMIVLFILFPRVPGPLWGLPAQRNQGITGLSDEMSPGTITQLAISDDIAFTVAFDGRRPRQSELYWRGPVLHDFDGRTWRGFGECRSRESDYVLSGRPLRYTITLEPHQRQWMFALDIPVQRPTSAKMRCDYSLVNRVPITRLKRYNITSVLDHQLMREPHARSLDRRLPENQSNARARAYGEALKRDLQDDTLIADQVLSLFREQPFIYTLLPEKLSRFNPVDDFLFNVREGFCEHYASAFAFVMRAAGVPARVVTGYQGGEINPITGRLEIRQSNAHAWTELWIGGRGWVRYDPVGAVAPARILDGLDGALGRDEPVPGRFFRNNPLFMKLRFGINALNSVWSDWILGYDEQLQRSVLARLWFRMPTWQDMTLAMTGFVLAWLALLSSYLFWRSRQISADRSQKLYQKYCGKLARLGLAREPWEGPLDFARRVTSSRPDLYGPVEAITDCYVRLRYGANNEDGALRRLRDLVTSFHPASSH